MNGCQHQRKIKFILRLNINENNWVMKWYLLLQLLMFCDNGNAVLDDPPKQCLWIKLIINLLPMFMIIIAAVLNATFSWIIWEDIIYAVLLLPNLPVWGIHVGQPWHGGGWVLCTLRVLWRKTAMWMVGILRWPDLIYFILIHFLTGPLYGLFSVNLLGPIGTADTPSGISTSLIYLQIKPTRTLCGSLYVCLLSSLWDKLLF